ncbi:4197_t:CDS:1, partial [Scutellospora calospora]
MSFSNECSICCEIIESIIQLYQLPCLHIYHVKCIESWLKKNENSKMCPYCCDSYDDEEHDIILRQIDQSRFMKLKRKNKEEQTIKESFDLLLKTIEKEKEMELSNLIEDVK